MPALLARLALDGALRIAQDILDAKARYLLAVKDNQPALHRDIDSYLETAPDGEASFGKEIDKGHGRLEIRTCRVSKAHRLAQSRALLSRRLPRPPSRRRRQIDTKVENKGKVKMARRWG